MHEHRVNSSTFSSTTVDTMDPPAFLYPVQVFPYPGPSMDTSDLSFHTYNHADISLTASTRAGSTEDEEESQVNGKESGPQSQSGDSKSRDDEGAKEQTTSPKKKPRITLARGGACVACRNRKLKCTGERPCKTCVKGQVECRYEEIQRRKPRAVLLEERVAELEALLTLRGETLPPSQLTGIPPHPMLSSPTNEDTLSLVGSKRPSFGASSSSGKLSPPTRVIPHLSLHSEMPMIPTNSNQSEIPANSPLELALIQYVLPHAPYLAMPVHPQRLLASLALSPSDPQRPHPALLYILFAEAVRLLENGAAVPQKPTPPNSLFPQSYTPPTPPLSADPSYLLHHVRGMSVALMERARSELDSGIRAVDRPLDLVRAAIGITRYLYSLGRFIEGWNIPVARLVVSCGLHRIVGTIVAPHTGPGQGVLPPPYASPYQYFHSRPNAVDVNGLPLLRTRPVIVPPPRDEIDLEERIMTFWAAKVQDWSASIGWGWSPALHDADCTTQWPQGWGAVEGGQTASPHYTIDDLFDPVSPLQTSPFPDSTYVLAIKSLALLHRASSLFDLAVSAVPTPNTHLPRNIPPLACVQEVDTAIRNFRKRIPPIFEDVAHTPAQSPITEEKYEGRDDPWWIVLHANLYTAEMMMWKEMAHHQRQGYQSAVSCARALVRLVRSMSPQQWVNVDMIVVIDLSLAARFLNKEAQRLAATGQSQASQMASEEAEVLRIALSQEYSKYLPMAGLHGLIVQRVREGWPEKEGEYERL